MLTAREITVAGPGQLSELRQALPGDVVVLKDGNWENATIRIMDGGDENRHLLVKAATPGAVILGGTSSLAIEAPYVTVEGLLFKHGALAKGAVVQFKSHDGIVRDSAIVDYNPADFRTAYHWVLFSGSNNRVEHCFFQGKNNLHAVVENGEPDCRHNAVVGCYFKDIPLRARTNGREIVKVLGAGHVDASSPDGAYFLLQDNLFEQADGEGVEVISLKSNFNKVLHNTIVASAGCLNIRRGDHNEVRNNVILGRGRPGAQGIRMSGANNLVQDNFISGCQYGIAVSSGEYWAAALTPGYTVNDRAGSAPNKARYPQNRHVTIRGNVTVGNSGPDLDIGAMEYKKHWPENQNVLIPEECRFERNTFVRLHGGVSVVGVEQDTAPPLDRFAFKPNSYADNLLYGGTNDFAAASGGFAEMAVPPGWTEDGALAAFKPLSLAQVGPAWMRATRQAAGADRSR